MSQDISSKLAAKDIQGRGLSKNDLTDSLRAKLDNLERNYSTRAISNVATRIFGGRMGTINNTTPKTYQVTTVAPQHFDAIRVIFANTNAGLTVNSINAKASVISSAADLNNSNGTWVQLLKSGGAIYCIPAAPGQDRISYTISDETPLKSVNRSDGGTFPLLVIRVYVVSTSTLPAYGNATAVDTYTNWATKPDGRIWVSRQQDGNHVTTTTGFNNTTNTNQSPIVGVEFLCQGRVVNVMAVGDSISDSITTYRGEGFGMLACSELTDMQGVAFEYANCGWAGQNSDMYYKRALDILNSRLRKPDILLFPTGSPNDATTITSAIIEAQAARVQRVIAKCAEKNVKLILWTWLPSNSNIKPYGETDALRVAENQRWVSLQSKDFIVADTASALAGITVGGQQQMLEGSTTDGIHPNDTGSGVIKSIIKPIIERLTGL